MLSNVMDAELQLRGNIPAHQVDQILQGSALLAVIDARGRYAVGHPYGSVERVRIADAARALRERARTPQPDLVDVGDLVRHGFYTADVLRVNAPVGMMTVVDHAWRARKNPEAQLPERRDEKAAEPIDIFHAVVDGPDHLQIRRPAGQRRPYREANGADRIDRNAGASWHPLILCCRCAEHHEQHQKGAE